ncbi:unnamed protein product [Malassezia sympodialis ATCC 42132]|nr:uncharacterized protein MSY001_2967 [Malassezia sympodialis ATCC 42132]CCV00262.1 unnamed protein product [Malassezia sympodialis ATCC 42132]|eukprot:XP_018741468.1 uncharacterized protein MSY001_2967 [Malassezia sympodialis ATCC 42132]
MATTLTLNENDESAVHGSAPHGALTPADESSPIRIVDAISSSEFSKTSYIVYVIVSPGHESKRRYSDFEALREALVELHPTLILPPLPSKHTLVDYATKQGRAKSDPALLARRKRMLERFLRRIDTHPVLRIDVVFRRFLDARYTWHEITRLPPLSTLPKNNLAAPPQNPADPDAPVCYSVLPLPLHPGKLAAPHKRFQESEAFTDRFQTHMGHTMEPANRRLMRRWYDIAADMADMGALLNAQSVAEHHRALATAFERTGQAADTNYLSLTEMLAGWEAQIAEPLYEYTQYASILQRIIRWRHLKHQQFELAQEMLEDKRRRLHELERIEANSARLMQALENGGHGLVPRATPVRAAAPTVSVYGRAAEDEEDEEEPPAAAEPEPPAPAPKPQPAARADASAPAPAPAPSPARRGFLGSLSDSLAQMMDMNSDSTRQSSISRLREETILLQEAMDLTAKDLDFCNRTIQASLDRFQRLKVADFRQLMLDLVRLHRDMCAKNLEAWRAAKEAVDEVGPDAWAGMPEAHLAPKRRGPHAWRPDA